MSPGETWQTRGTDFLHEGTLVTLVEGRTPPLGTKWRVKVHGFWGLAADWLVEESCLAPVPPEVKSAPAEWRRE
jgi:hypothetical protein